MVFLKLLAAITHCTPKAVFRRVVGVFGFSCFTTIFMFSRGKFEDRIRKRKLTKDIHKRSTRPHILRAKNMNLLLVFLVRLHGLSGKILGIYVMYLCNE